MQELAQFFNEAFDATLSDDFIPRASYYPAMDYVEYVSRDTTCVYDRIDDVLTLIYDREQKETIGFKIKGFKYFFNTELKKEFDLNEDHFLPLVDVIEKLLTKLGAETYGKGQNKIREQKYKEAAAIATKDKVAFKDYGALAA